MIIFTPNTLIRSSDVNANFATAVSGGKRQDDTTNSTVPNQILQSGFGVGVVGVANAYSEVITFPTAFTTRPIVVGTFGGDHASSTLYGNGGSNIHGLVTFKIVDITLTSFRIYIYQNGGTNWNAGNTVFYQWLAVGV
jgi:hypothetical protein